MPGNIVIKLTVAIRITGGIWRGRLLAVPENGVRPTQDRVRAAIFSAWQDIIREANVLDLFAGTGAFGLEALSRGAAFACFVENDRKALSYLKKNIEQLLGNQRNDYGKDDRRWRIAASDVGHFLTENTAKTPFDIIFADPPYDVSGEWSKKILFHLSRRPILSKDGYLIIESSAKSPLIKAEGWNIYRERLYGETRICVYKVQCSGFPPQADQPAAGTVQG